MKDEMLFENEWVSLRKITHGKSIHGYVYSHETRCGGKIVSILPFRKVFDVGDNSSWKEFLFRKEITPCWGPMPILSTITGGVESDHPVEDAVREIKEESGYDVPEIKMWWLGTCRASKSTDTEYFLYTVDLTDMVQGEALGDGSGLEAEATVEWLHEDEVHSCVDPLASVIAVRARNL